MPADPNSAASEIAEFVAKIHASGKHFLLAITGGGTRAISDLLTVPGGSRTVLGAIVPYCEAALTSFLSAKPEQFCAPRTARAMAMAAFDRARAFSHKSTSGPCIAGDGIAGAQHLIGIACTASLASDRPKRGAHRLYVATQSATATVTYSLELAKDQRTRSEEESIAARIILNAIAAACDVPTQLPIALLAGETIHVEKTSAPPEWTELLLGQCKLHLNESTAVSNTPPNYSTQAIFPGAFNPLHEGHEQMADIATKQLSKPVAFEISIENVDKPPLDFTEMEHRAAQFNSRSLPLFFTRAPTFEAKSELFPGATFIVGADTIVRIGKSRYYGSDLAATDAAFQNLANRGCRFLVFGRQVNGRFQSLADLDLPPALRKLCDEVPESSFRADVSSTELRNR